MINRDSRRDNCFQIRQLETDVLKKETHEIIKELFSKGMAKKAIARFLKVDIKTVRHHLKKAGWTPYQRPQKEDTLLSPYFSWISKRLREVNYNARVLYRELCYQGYTGSYDTIKKFIAPYRTHHLSKACVRYETKPGKQAQVDWGSSQVWLGEKRVKIHIFAFVLGYSRRLFGRVYFSEQFTPLIQAHEAAFQWFGGIVEEVLYDNPKTMVIQHNISTGEVILNSKFKDFASYYGFKPRFCQPYRPQTKGKIESGVKYIKRNFLAGRRFSDLSHLNRELERWCLEVADQRIHGTTHQKPAILFEQEQLAPLTRSHPYVFHPTLSRKVSREGRVYFESNQYSVPWKYIGKCVDLKVCGKELTLFYQGKLLATHPFLQEKHQQSIQKEHFEGLLSYQATRKEICMPQCDPYWRREDRVEVRDLAIYEKASLSQGGASC